MFVAEQLRSTIRYYFSYTRTWKFPCLTKASYRIRVTAYARKRLQNGDFHHYLVCK